MTRFSSFARGLSASWVATVVVTVYSLVSVPLALHYIGAEQFALWALLLQIQGYFILIEIGMTGASGRILIDHKDNPSGTQYLSTLSTSNLIFVAQAAIIVFAGWSLAPMIVDLFNIPAPHREDFTILLRLAAGIAALGILIRFSGALLYAHQRLDLLNYSSILSTLAALVTMWMSLAAGYGLYALAVSQFAAWAVGAYYGINSCYRLGLFRWCDLVSGISLRRAKELLHFGKDMFAFNLGTQLLDASQIMIVTKTMGLQAAAVWAVSSKLFVLVSQLVARMQGVAMVYFAEMIVRQETLLLKKRFRNIYQLSASLAVCATVVVVATNNAFVTIWADKSLAWTSFANLLFAVLVVINSCCRCGAELIVHTKNLAGLRFVYFFEGAAFVGLATVLGQHFGILGILVAALSCALLFRGMYVLATVSRFLDVPRSCLFFTWIRRSTATAVLALPVAVFLAYIASVYPLEPSAGFALTLSVSAASATLAFLAIGCPRDVRAELFKRVTELLCKLRAAAAG